ncbi:uncharacterized protein [Onthophagus taurus]|uniref:uncharacterized protein n=1 Tax=Onthophagus taurus TaxID=166361 RepID=UPI000C20D519|nr:uncharacterized protein LOC111428485 [Onthophagus taurus]
MALITKFTVKHLLGLGTKTVQTVATRSAHKKGETQSNSYIIIRPDKHNYSEIVDVMYDSYFRDEPIVRCLGVGKMPNSVLEEEIVRELSQGLSLIAKCKYDGCIVGGAINCGACPWDPDVMDKFACTLSNQKMRQLFQFWAYIQRAPNLWNLTCTRKIFEISHLFVLPDERNKGLASQLIKKSIETGADCGFTCIRVDASTAKTAKICEKIGMKLVYEIPYCSYLGTNQRPVIEPHPTETSVKTYVTTPHFPKKK